MRLLYKPFGMLSGLLAGFLSRRIFSAVWSRVDERDPPSPLTEQTSWPRMLSATALNALTSSLTRASAERIGAQTFRYLTGAWPGKKSR